MTGAISDGAASVGLAALAKVSRLPSKCALVDLTLGSARKRHAIGLELSHRNRRFSCHVLDGVLISKPVGTFHGVVEVPAPVVFMHVSQRRIDASLGSDGVRTRWEQLADACGLESHLRETKGGAKTRTASTHNDCVVSVVDNSVVSNFALSLKNNERCLRTW